MSNGSRSMTNAAQTASLAVSGYSMVLMMDLDFVSGHVYAHTGTGTIVFNGHSFLGLGRFGTVSEVQESVDLSAPVIEFSLSGVHPEYVSTALNENYKNRTALLYMAFLDSSGTLVADPVTVYSGGMDTMPITLGATATIRVRAISKQADWNRPRTLRFNNETQLALFPGDKGFEFTPQMVSQQLLWGRV